MQTEMEHWKQRKRYLISVPCIVLFRVALLLYRRCSVSELFDTEAAVIYSLLGVLWLHEMIWWIKDRWRVHRALKKDEHSER